MGRQIKIKSSYDFDTKYFIPLVLVTLLITVYLIGKNQDYSSLIGVVILFILAGCFSVALIPYRITLLKHDFLQLMRIHNSIKIQFSEIVEVDLLDFEELKRLYGIGGFLGYYGNYESFRYGKIKLMAKSSRNIIVVCTKEYTIAFSVDDPDYCEQLIRESINHKG